MTSQQNDSNTGNPAEDKPANADRIAKVIARAGLASRRQAERLILEGKVRVNGAKITSPALDVLPSDTITVDGKKLDEPQETRLWLYYKPVGLVTTEADEKGRQTVFDALPEDLPRVMTIGRLDLTSEGLLLLTNDGDLKRRLELPATGWLRRYRVRVNGTPSDITFAPLRRGAVIDGEEFAPMEIRLDSQQGANAWLTVGIREGKNREIRRAMTHVGLQVNRLIRVAYGPFRLTGMEKNQVVEVKRRVLRDQLGGLLTGEMQEQADGDTVPRRPFAGKAQFGEGKPRGASLGSDRRGDRGDPRVGQGKPRFSKGRDETARDGDRPFRSGPKGAGRPDRADRDGAGTRPDKPRSAKGPKPFERSERKAGPSFSDDTARDRSRQGTKPKFDGAKPGRSFKGKPAGAGLDRRSGPGGGKPYSPKSRGGPKR